MTPITKESLGLILMGTMCTVALKLHVYVTEMTKITSPISTIATAAMACACTFVLAIVTGSYSKL